jgi:hypothetical protein
MREIYICAQFSSVLQAQRTNSVLFKKMAKVLMEISIGQYGNKRYVALITEMTQKGFQLVKLNQNHCEWCQHLSFGI